MNWGYVLAIVGSNIGIGAIVCGFMMWALNKLDADIKSLSNKVDADNKAHIARMDQFAVRTDQLYQMFVDSQTEFHNKFYELLKDRKSM